MKKLFIAFIFNLIVAGASAQGMAVTNAILFHKDSILDKAKEQIDKAAVHEKTSTQAKTWYYKGLIYMDLARSGKSEFRALVPNGANEAFEAFQKAQQLDKPNGEYSKMAGDKLNELWVVNLNEGIKLSQDEKYKESIKAYETAQKIRPTDTTAFLYAAMSAEELKDNQLIKNYYNKLIEMNYQNAGIFSYLAYLYREDKEVNKALEVLDKGRKIFPNDKKLMEDEINIYIAEKRFAEAKTKMEAAIKVSPNNPLLHLNLGILYEKSGDKEKALASYKKALELEPNNYDANFNLGAYYYNQAADIIKKVNAMNLATYQKEGKAKEDQAIALMKQGLPYFEKAYQTDSADPNTKKILKDIYTRCNMDSKAAALK